jgi:lysozyme
MDIALLEKELKRDEGERLFPYVDTVGKTTIGVGRNLTDRGIDPDESALMLHNDIQHVIQMLDASLPWWKSLTDARQRVLANMCFNLGWPRLMLFKRMLAAMQAGDVEEAVAEMMNSTWAKQVGARSQRLADQWRAG